MPEQPGPGQESVWDYPRPPALRASSALVVIELGGEEVCRTSAGFQVLETSHPPSWYLPPEAWTPGSLRPGDGSSFCEWKGAASYLDVVGGDRVERAAAWTYPAPSAAFAALAGYVAVYPGRMGRCTVGNIEHLRGHPVRSGKASDAIGVEIRGMNARAGFGQRHGNRLPDALGRAGDERRASVEAH